MKTKTTQGFKAQLEFRPTRDFIKDHPDSSKGCKDKECLCLVDDWHGNYGVCVGINPYHDDSPDIISLCCSYYDPETRKPVGHRFLWHPQEANWIGTLLTLASVEAWGMIPQYRTLVNKLVRKRDRGIGSHKTGRK